MKIMIGPARLRNAGDMAILMSMVHNLREAYPNASFIALLGLPANPNNRYANFFEEHNVKLLSGVTFRPQAKGRRAEMLPSTRMSWVECVL